ncbi:AI-2E family transporter [Lysobacter korlensis]|uniref:AI-2E family transporter n=1 Tax=Lysobacter korlensis TaxID=553636 RepID=A0ABV6RT21_9GAMM
MSTGPDDPPRGVVMLSRGEYMWRVAMGLLIALVIYICWQVSDLLLVGFGGIVFAVVIRTIAGWISRHSPIPMHWASILVVLLLLVGTGGVAWLVGDQITNQFHTLRTGLPEALARAQRSLGSTVVGDWLAGITPEMMNSDAMAKTAMVWAQTLLELGSKLLIVFLLAAYLAISPREYVSGFLELIPVRHRTRTAAVLTDSGDALGWWMIGQITAMVIVGVATWLGLKLVGVPNAGVLGLIAGLLEFVPVLGPFVSAVPGLLFALAVGPETAFYALLVYVAVQQGEGALIQPLVQRWAVEVPPALVLLALVVFGSLFGLIGALFAVPLAVVIIVVVRRVYLDMDEPLAGHDN